MACGQLLLDTTTKTGFTISMSASRGSNVRLWKIFTESFNCLPVTATIDDKILCMHGGLSPEPENLDQIREITRSTDVPYNGLLCDLLWSESHLNADGWAGSDRSVSCTFGADKVIEFLDKNDLDLICRGHQVVEEGNEFFAKRRPIIIFSAPNYGGEFDNAGALSRVDENLLCAFEILKPEDCKAPTSSNSSSNSSTTALKKVQTTKAQLARDEIQQHLGKFKRLGLDWRRI